MILQPRWRIQRSNHSAQAQIKPLIRQEACWKPLDCPCNWEKMAFQRWLLLRHQAMQQVSPCQLY